MEILLRRQIKCAWTLAKCNEQFKWSDFSRKKKWYHTLWTHNTMLIAFTLAEILFVFDAGDSLKLINHKKTLQGSKFHSLTLICTGSYIFNLEKWLYEPFWYFCQNSNDLVLLNWVISEEWLTILVYTICALQLYTFQGLKSSDKLKYTKCIIGRHRRQKLENCIWCNER